jgi:hypothetical protein
LFSDFHTMRASRFGNQFGIKRSLLSISGYSSSVVYPDLAALRLCFIPRYYIEKNPHQTYFHLHASLRKFGNFY